VNSPDPRLSRNFTGTRLPAVLIAAGAALGLGGCVSVKTQHKIEPIHITMDVNLRLEQELEETFSALDEQTNALAEEAGKGGTE